MTDADKPQGGRMRDDDFEPLDEEAFEAQQVRLRAALCDAQFDHAEAAAERC